MAQQRKIGKTATSIFTENGATRVIYHGTPVVTFDAESVTLKSGGWRTATTKTRMNQAANQFGLGFSVSQKGGEWFIDTPQGRVPFVDGMRFARSAD